MRQCKKCGQDTEMYFWCNNCVKQFAPESDPAWIEKTEALWELEEDAYVMAKLYAGVSQ